MDSSKRNTALIATVGTTVFCGLPGLCLCLMGGMFAVVGTIPGSDIDIGGSSDPQAAIGMGIGILCLSLVFIAIPVVVGFVTLRKKPEDAAINVAPMASSVPPVSTVDSDPFPNDDPLPPPS